MTVSAITHPRFRTAAFLVAGYAVVDVVWLQTGFGGERATQSFSDLSACFCAAVAAGVCAWAWRRDDGASRNAWLLLTAAMAMFAIGEIAWTSYELGLGREVPFPSIADIGFLGAVPFAAAAMLAFPTAPVGLTSRVRTVLDAVTIGASLLFIAWATYLAPVYRASRGSFAEQAIGLTYPLADIVILGILIFVLARAAPGSRAPLMLIAAGLAALAIADSAFAYLTSSDAYQTGGAIDAAWDVGYLLIALGALRAAPQVARTRRREHRRMGFALPYLPVVAVVVVSAVKHVAAGRVDPVLFWGTLGIVLLVVARQLITLVQNVELARDLEVQVAEGEVLRRQAFHDPLTGLPNSALFYDRAQHALERSARNGRTVAVLFCDLDNLKEVNDRYGHHAGDELIAAVAARLAACIRRSDTVARLGGDEFAILLEDGADERVAVQLGDRILDALRDPFEIEDATVSAATSIGIAVGLARDVGVDDLVRHADTAMYAAKAAGKARLEIFHPSMMRSGLSREDLEDR